MNPKHILFVCLFLSEMLIFAQANARLEATQNDLSIFKAILEQGHPTLYKHTNKFSLDSLVSALNKETNSSQPLSLLKNLYKIANVIRDGHINIYPPANLILNSTKFPLTLKIIQNEVYNAIENDHIPIGATLKSINGVPIKRIISSMKKYIPVDGHLEQKRHRFIEQNFNIYYHLEYGKSKKYTIHFIDSLGIEKIVELTAITQTELNISRDQGNNIPPQFIKKSQNPYVGANSDKISVLYDTKNHIALLKIKSFSIGSSNFNKLMDQLFTEFKKHKISNLILDIRNNHGGLRANTLRLMSYITNEFYKQRTTEHIGVLEIPFKEFTLGSYYEEELGLKEKFKNHPVYNGWTSSFDNLESLMVPTKTWFTGSVYVLINGATLNEASDFALLAKNNSRITLVGEETGCSYDSHNIGLTVHYKLPHSGIQFSINLKNVQNYVSNPSVNKSSGVTPDRFIPYTFNDLVTCNDPQLTYVLQLLSNKKS
ncbi:S41 family peptidase [Aquimarina intermedia]|uniref:Peptidase S41-like protein n=1 Tax=Aquimarina intermedia TaxID=350814 RepID=A0A5S5BYF7_9FLAO|nr:S41 family peptidase [Aquimarina intermedia]TYP72205.1 peptidase S41-like protein [Aquimarina intermedia]